MLSLSINVPLPRVSVACITRLAASPSNVLPGTSPNRCRNWTCAPSARW